MPVPTQPLLREAFVSSRCHRAGKKERGGASMPFSSPRLPSAPALIWAPRLPTCPPAHSGAMDGGWQPWAGGQQPGTAPSWPGEILCAWESSGISPWHPLSPAPPERVSQNSELRPAVLGAPCRQLRAKPSARRRNCRRGENRPDVSQNHQLHPETRDPAKSILARSPGRGIMGGRWLA